MRPRGSANHEVFRRAWWLLCGGAMAGTNVEGQPTKGGLDHHEPVKDLQARTADGKQEGRALLAVKAMFRRGQPAKEEVATLLRTDPGARDEIVAYLNTQIGMGFAKSVVALADEAKPVAKAEWSTPRLVRVTATDYVNVRDSASKAGAILGGIHSNEEVEAIGQEGDWFRIDYKGRPAFIKAEFAQLVPSAAKPAVGSTAPGGSPAGTAVGGAAPGGSPAGGAAKPADSTGAVTTTTAPPPTTEPATAKPTPAATPPIAASPLHHQELATTAVTVPEETIAARSATMEQITAASTSDQGKDALDIKWIDELPAHMRNEIDTNFYSDAAAEEWVAGASAKGVTQIDAEQNKLEQQLKKDTAERLKHLNGKAPKAADIAADDTYKAEHATIEKERADRKRELIAKTAREHDKAMPAHVGDRAQSVVKPKTATITRQEGQMIARTNFMSWAVHVFHTADAAKQHFLGKLAGKDKDNKNQYQGGIRLVSGQRGMWLADAAATRFEAARADFEAKHPGYTFPDTDVAQDMRGFHQDRKGIGMLGHAIGEAFDFLAVDNPNIKIDDNGHNYAYLVGKFGGKDGKRGTGRTTMVTSEAAIEQRGKDTWAGKPEPAPDTMIENLRAQFHEMSVSSDKMKHARSDAQLKKLDAARDLFFSEPQLKLAAKAAQDAAKNPHPIITARLKAEGVTEPAAVAARTVQIQAELEAAAREATDASINAQGNVIKALKEVFDDWITAIQADIDVDTALLTANEASRTTMTTDEKSLADIDATADDWQAKLDAFATAHQLTPFAKQKKLAQHDGKAFQKSLMAELKSRDASATKGLAKKDGAAHADITALEWYRDRLTNPSFVFGKGVAVAWEDNDKRKPATHWESKYDASQVPLMQVLEHGTVRDDAMPARGPGDKKQQVFNGETIATLARYGWAPGAAFGDTMHFDFIEGYNKAVPGGRSGENMEQHRYSPEGDYKAPPKK